MTPMKDVYFFEAFEEEEAALRKYMPPQINAAYTWKTIQESDIREVPARIVSLRTQSILPLEWAPHLGGLLSRSTGYDHLVAYRAHTGVPVPCAYLPLYCARAVAEQAMLLWLGLLRNLRLQLSQFETFHRDGITGRECEKKRLVVVGVGNIGHEVVKIGRGLGMETCGVDLVERHADVVYAPAAQALGQADVVVCAMNLTARNRGYFNAAGLQKIRPGALFVNIARGELSPAQDLLQALDTGLLAGVGLDVYNHESELAVALRSGRASQDPEVAALLEIRRRPNVLCTPHNAFNTVESVERKSAQSAEQVTHFLDQGAFKWLIPEAE